MGHHHGLANDDFNLNIVLWWHKNGGRIKVFFKYILQNSIANNGTAMTEMGNKSN